MEMAAEVPGHYSSWIAGDGIGGLEHMHTCTYYHGTDWAGTQSAVLCTIFHFRLFFRSDVFLRPKFHLSSRLILKKSRNLRQIELLQTISDFL